MSLDPLTLDQADYAALYDADPFFSQIKVLAQFKGVTENDIQVALSTLNERDGKIGAVLIVIMPELQPDTGQTPSPRYFVRIGLQVIAQPLLADDATSGVGLSAEQISERVRQIGQNRKFGRSNSFMFDGMEPLPVDEGKVSYGVYFRRAGGDAYVPRVATPALTSEVAVLPATGWTVTMTVPPGATGWYTTDGTLPTELNGTEYTGPFNVPAAATVRASAVQTGFQQSEPVAIELS